MGILDFIKKRTLYGLLSPTVYLSPVFGIEDYHL